MSNEINEGRRSALKKLGLGTGAVYVAPAVTALVVPRHATATSSSGSSGGGLTSSDIRILSLSEPYPIEIRVAAGGTDYSSVSTLVIAGTTVTKSFTTTNISPSNSSYDYYTYQVSGTGQLSVGQQVTVVVDGVSVAGVTVETP